MRPESRAVLVALRRIIRATDLGAKQLARYANLTTSQFLVLQLLNSETQLSAGQIARNMNFAKPTVTAILDHLDRLGLITRKRDDIDRRQVVVGLTEKGRQTLEAAPLPLQQKFLTEFEQLADWERTLILSCLQRVCTMLGATGIDASPILDVGAIGRINKPDE